MNRRRILRGFRPVHEHLVHDEWLIREARVAFWWSMKRQPDVTFRPVIRG